VSLSTGAGKLSFALKNLRAQWELAALNWNDKVSQEFDELHLKPLEQELMAVLNATNTLAQIIVKARQECQ
jgi:hypothetical protein